MENVNKNTTKLMEEFKGDAEAQALIMDNYMWIQTHYNIELFVGSTWYKHNIH